jgi:hypothetical protein
MEPFLLLTVKAAFFGRSTGQLTGVAPAPAARELPCAVQTGDTIELRRPDGSSIGTFIGRALLSNDGSQLLIFLPNPLRIVDVPQGTEIWWIS